MSSCIGSFTLFNKFAKWETQMTSNKYVNAIVGFIITPFVGSVCLLGDALLFNTIEFWSGSNPIADIGKTRTIMGQDGRYYAVTTLKDGYEIKAPTGEVTNLKYNKKNNSWTMEQNGASFNCGLPVKQILGENGSRMGNDDRAACPGFWSLMLMMARG